MSKVLKINKALILIFCLIAVWPKNIVAQDLKKTLEEMREAYNKMTSMHIVMLVDVYETRQSTEKYYSMKADIKRRDNQYLYRYGGSHMLMNDHYFIMVDEAEKEMLWGRVENDENKMPPDVMGFNLDSIMTMYDEPEFIGDEHGARHYHIMQKSGVVSDMDLWVDKQSKMLRKMDYQYREGPFVKIEFEKFAGNPSFSNDEFSETRFIRLQGDKIVPSSQYQGYHLIESSQEKF